MQVSKCITCAGFPCADVNHNCYIVPRINIPSPAEISMVMIAEAAPEAAGDYFYAKGDPLFQRTTIQAFNDAGADVSSVRELMKMGIYLTTAVKCGKTDYGIKARTVEECSLLLQDELQLFPKIRVIMLMGDVAIKAINYIGKRTGEGRVIPSGPTYKIRKQEYHFRGKRVLPSYLQAGPSYFIERSKRRMIAEDIAAALHLIGQAGRR